MGPPSYDRNEIADYLAKPAVVSSGLFSATDTANSSLASFSISAALLNNVMWARKIAGYKLIRATAHVKVVVNANPFQQGRLILTFLPCYEHFSVGERLMRNRTLAQVTTQPNVELDIGDTTMEMAIPYITPSFYYDTGLDHYDWGSVFLRVLSPLQHGATGPTDCSYTIFLWFSDVELAAPVYTPESSKAIITRKKRNRDSNLLSTERKQSGERGVISTTLDSLSTASKVLSDVPFLGSYAGIVSSVTSKAAGVAKMFGWSKPMNSSVVSPLAQRPFKSNHTSDGSDDAYSLSLSGMAQVEPISDFAGASVDEMSMAFLKKVDAYLTSFAWTATSPYDTQLYSLDLALVNLVTNGVEQNVAGTQNNFYITGQPVFVLSKLFSLWRGGIEVTLKFVKTQYHTGRLAIYYSPSGGTQTVSQSQYLLREIVDLRSTTSVSLKIPYLKNVAYLSTGPNGSYSYYGINDDSLGTLQIRVLDQLRAPETAAQEIKVLVYAKPAEDFELSITTGGNLLPYQPQSSVRRGKMRRNYSRYTPESALSSVLNTSLVDKPIGDSEIPASNLHYNASCVADPVISLKQLLTCLRRISYNSSSVISTNLNINPSATSVFSRGNTDAMAGPSGGIYGDYINILSAAYAMCRGGYRISRPVFESGTAQMTLLPEVVDRVPVTSTAVSGLGQPNANLLTDGNLRSAPLTIVRYTQAEGTMDVHFPHYTRTPVRLCRFQSVGIPAVLPSGGPSQMPDMYSYRGFSAAAPGASTTGDLLFRSGSDDFCLGYFIGFPPMVWLSAPSL